MKFFTIEQLPEFDDHELVSFFADKEIGLKGFIAIHNTNLGPATGGTRYKKYASEQEALQDALNLSRAMTYKCALAGVPYGGGKAVIMAQPRFPKTEKFLSRYAEKINLLNGSFYTGEDVGIDESDIRTLARHSQFIVGRPDGAGDPSPWAALSVFYAIQVGLQSVFGSATVRGRTVAVKGLGKVGFELCRLIFEAGGHIAVADLDVGAIRRATKRFPGIRVVPSAKIHCQKVDVYAPCALGGEFDTKRVRELKCRVVCGSANNQLVSPESGRALYRRGILYIPDYVANVGGLINVKAELHPDGYSRKRVATRVARVRGTVRRIIALSRKNNLPTDTIADELAEKIFKKK